MTACVAIAPDSSRMENSGTCGENLHGRMSDDLDPAFLPAVGLLKKVDADFSTYMTASEREDQVSDVTPAAQVESTHDLGNDASAREAETITSIISQDLVELDVEQLETNGSGISPQMELKATPAYVVEGVSDTSVRNKTDEKEGSDDALELENTVAEEQPNFVDLIIKHNIVEVCDVDSPMKAEVAVTQNEVEKFTEGADIAENVKVGDGEVQFKEGSEIGSVVNKEENLDRNEDIDAENPDRRIHAYSDTSINTDIELPAEFGEMTLLESSITSPLPANGEDTATKTDGNLTKSLSNHTKKYPFQFLGLNHIAFCCESLERSLDFYCGLLGLKTDLDRPDLPYRGAWLSLGAEGIHIMEVPNPDPVKNRPPHGGYDRHACLNVRNVDHLRMTFDKAGINYQLSVVPSIFCRDPDGNGLEFIEVKDVHVE